MGSLWHRVSYGRSDDLHQQRWDYGYAVRSREGPTRQAFQKRGSRGHGIRRRYGAARLRTKGCRPGTPARPAARGPNGCGTTSVSMMRRLSLSPSIFKLRAKDRLAESNATATTSYLSPRSFRPGLLAIQTGDQTWTTE